MYVEGQPESSKLEEFGSFKYWREPVPTLDLKSILQEVRQSSPTGKDKESASDSSSNSTRVS